VVITGVSGFIGSWVANLFLQDGGFKVVGTVRDKDNATKVQPLRDGFGAMFD
jgi:nucleoside-diphosphate-sugar epimerase